MAEIRRERAADVAAIRNVNDRAFGGPNEGAVVDRLRETCDDLLSLVAEVEGRVVGHVLFSPAILELDGGGELPGLGLAPLAVLPEWQNRGIGGELVRAGLAAVVRESPRPFVIVLGHPDYYPRFGFERASGRGVRCQWQAPDDAFMVLVMDEDAMLGATGLARYRPEWDAAV